MTAAVPEPPQETGFFRRWGALVQPSVWMLVCVVGLLAVGFIALFSASAFAADNPYAYILRQGVGLMVAMVAGVVAWRIDLDWARRQVPWVGLAIVAGLVATLVLGISVKGSRRWLDLGPMNLQFSELAKLGVVFVLAHYLASQQSQIHRFIRGFVVPLAIIAVPAALILMQPDFGATALCGAVGLALLFLAGAPWRYLLPAGALAASLLGVMVWLNPNRLGRLLAFLDVEGNRQDGTYQLYQALLAFGAGGLDGVGVGNGRQQLHFLPEAHNDFIFAIWGEEMGLPFTLAVVALFTAFFALGLLHLRRAPNLFGYLLVAGCLLLVSLQAIVNLGVVTGLLPTKGMGLPFVSYGGSNLLLMGLVLGLLFNTRRSWDRPALAPRSGDMEDFAP